MNGYPDLRAFAIHPTTSLCSARLHKELSLFPKRFYKDGFLQRGYNLDKDTLTEIHYFMGSYLSPEELLGYCITAYHFSDLMFYPEHYYYKIMLKDTVFINLNEGEWVRRLAEYSLNMVDFYFYKFPNKRHTDLYLDLYFNYNILNNLMPGFGTWLAKVGFQAEAQQLISYWYGARDINYWATIKPTLRSKKVSSEPDYEWIFDESKYPDRERSGYV